MKLNRKQIHLSTVVIDVRLREPNDALKTSYEDVGLILRTLIYEYGLPIFLGFIAGAIEDASRKSRVMGKQGRDQWQVVASRIREAMDSFQAHISAITPTRKVKGSAEAVAPSTTYDHKQVALEGTLDLQRTPAIRPFECKSDCRSPYKDFLTGIAYTETGASNVANVESLLELLNGKRVRVTVEWSD